MNFYRVFFLYRYFLISFLFSLLLANSSLAVSEKDAADIKSIVDALDLSEFKEYDVFEGEYKRHFELGYSAKVKEIFSKEFQSCISSEMLAFSLCTDVNIDLSVFVSAVNLLQEMYENLGLLLEESAFEGDLECGEVLKCMWTYNFSRFKDELLLLEQRFFLSLIPKEIL
jgi:hypothetical protein